MSIAWRTNSGPLSERRYAAIQRQIAHPPVWLPAHVAGELCRRRRSVERERRRVPAVPVLPIGSRDVPGSAPIWTYNFQNNAYSNPLGLRIGQVIRSGKTVFNGFVEPQYSVAWRAGARTARLADLRRLQHAVPSVTRHSVAPPGHGSRAT